jgi:hypothetical protein
MAADGNNAYAKIVSDRQKLLRFIDGQIYFGNRIGYNRVNMDEVQQEAVLMAKGLMRHHDIEAFNSSFTRFDENDEFSRKYAEMMSNLDDSVPDVDNLFPVNNTENKPTEVKPATNAKVTQPAAYDESFFYNSTATLSRPHRLAYFLLVHKDFDNVLALIKSLLDPFVVILIHVDAKNPMLKTLLLDFLARQSAPEYSRIRVMKKSFNGLWGSSSLVMAQLAGFFELQELDSQWEYVVNLSGNDYPLRHNDVIYDDLKRNYDGKNLIEYWSSWDGK